ncbi:trigger factor [Proteinivorax hydrogeniformans]|uniref:Trigger factor n=1 Tax=Proteinivorax hydrogeniformans TaxID=1826727 RepID=A0AAU8HWE4_9FIRM
MKVNWEKKENNQGVLTVEVPAENVESSIEKAYKKMRKDIEIPGFRKGRVPRKIIENRFGVEVFYEEAANFMLQEFYPKAIEESGIEPVAQPEIDVEELEAGKPFIFKATVTVKPEVELGEYKDLGITKTVKEVSDEDVDAEVKSMQEKNAELIVADENTEIAEGDTAVIDFEGYIGEEAFEGGKGENHPLVIGSKSFIPGFEEQLVGKKLGDELDVKVTFPKEYHAESLAGKEATFKVKINEVKTKKLPELNDEFAKDNNFDSLDELKKDVKEKLEQQAEEQGKREFEQAVIDKVTENAKVDIPEVMVDNRLEDMVKEMEQRLSSQGMNLETYLQFTGGDLETMKAELKPQAEKDVKTNLVIETVVENEGIEVTEEDFEDEIKKLAEMYKQEVDKIKEIFSMPGQKESIEDGIKRRKAVELLLENS